MSRTLILAVAIFLAACSSMADGESRTDEPVGDGRWAECKVAAGIVIEYPAEWSIDSGREAPGGCVFRGGSGYVQASYFGTLTEKTSVGRTEGPQLEHMVGSETAGSTSAPTLDSGAQLHSSHHLEPYGSEPRISELSVSGQPARLISPSADQDASFEGIAELLVELPEDIAAGVGWSMLMLYANREHIEEIAARIRFG